MMDKKNKSSIISRIKWEFVLYIMEDSVASMKAESTLRQICDRYLSGQYKLTIVDIDDESAQIPPDIYAVPTAVRIFPRPEMRVIGDLSAISKTLKGLGLEELQLLNKINSDI